MHEHLHVKFPGSAAVVVMVWLHELQVRPGSNMFAGRKQAEPSEGTLEESSHPVYSRIALG